MASPASASCDRPLCLPCPGKRASVVSGSYRELKGGYEERQGEQDFGTEVSGGQVMAVHDAGDHLGPGTWMLGHRSRTTGSGVSQRSLVRRNGSVGRSDERAPAGGVSFCATGPATRSPGGCSLGIRNRRRLAGSCR